MPTKEEKAAFSQRLVLALRRSPDPVQGATELALRFNLRHHGNTVSAQTTHKWLTERAIPTNDKLATLAQWLNVSEHWLHYGPPPGNSLHVGEHQETYGTRPANKSSATSKNLSKQSPEVISLAAKIQALPPHRRYLVEELVKQLQQGLE